MLLVEHPQRSSSRERGYRNMSIIQSFFMTQAGSSDLDIEVLMIGGGGGAKALQMIFADDFTGNQYGGGGGGAGGLYIHTATLESGASQTVTIGLGGNGSNDGGDTTFTGAVAAEGGGRGARHGQPSGSGGSSGGGVDGTSVGSPVSGQGNTGGTGNESTTAPGAGGGGGKGSAGANATSGEGADGGSGYDLANFIGGSSTIVADGGGGAGNGGQGANGDGSTSFGNRANNTGAGARCPTTNAAAARGGSGRVIVRYAGSTTKATGGDNITTVTVGGNPYVIHDFTSDGTFAVD